MTYYIKLVLILIIISAGATLDAQESDFSNSLSLYSLTEGYWITDSAVIDLRKSGYLETAVIMLKDACTANSDTGFVVISKGIEEDAVIAAGDIVETNKNDYIYFLCEHDSLGNIVRSPDPKNVAAYEWNLLGFGNHDSEENAFILREYLDGSLEARGKPWYHFMVILMDRIEYVHLYGYLTE